MDRSHVDGAPFDGVRTRAEGWGNGLCRDRVFVVDTRCGIKMRIQGKKNPKLTPH